MILYLHHLLDYKAAIAKRAAPVADLGCCHVALGQEIAPQAIGDLAGIDSVVLLLGRSNRAQHQRMRYLHLLGMRKQVIVNPPSKDRRFHGDGPGLRHRSDPLIQLPAGRSILPS